MANFARIQNNVVQEVIVVSDSDCCGGVFPESEVCGQAFIASLNLDGDWLQTSYTERYRANYAGIGSIYDPALDVFYQQKTEGLPASWRLDQKYKWSAPVPMPETGLWEWDEAELRWVLDERFLDDDRLII